MNSAYDALLHEVCVRLGFCGSVVDGEPLHVDLFLPEMGHVDADDFADAVFKAEGWDPYGPGAHDHRQSLCEAFVRHIGGSEADARMLR